VNTDKAGMEKSFRKSALVIILDYDQLFAHNFEKNLFIYNSENTSISVDNISYEML